MKKLVILTLFLSAIPAFATCSIDNNGTTCTMASDFVPHQMQQTYSKDTNVSEYSHTPEVRLKPARNDTTNEMLQTFRDTEKNFNYNSNCQFGICAQNKQLKTFRPEAGMMRGARQSNTK